MDFSESQHHQLHNLQQQYQHHQQQQHHDTSSYYSYYYSQYVKAETTPSSYHHQQPQQYNPYDSQTTSYYQHEHYSHQPPKTASYQQSYLPSKTASSYGQQSYLLAKTASYGGSAELSQQRGDYYRDAAAVGTGSGGGGYGNYSQGRDSTVGQSPFRGGGRRGGPYRGSGRGGSSSPHFRGRGRGRGRGGPQNPPPDSSSSAHPELSVAAANEPGPTGEGPKEPPVAKSNEETQQSVPNQKQPIRIAWCELCKVDCTSKEILEEQHKNGKKHKKNLQKLGVVPIGGETIPDPNTENSQKSDGNSLENVPTGEAVPNNQEQNPSKGEKRGTKRKLKGGRGGKIARTFGGRAAEPNKPKIIMCDLCNVKCDTQEVFDRHVAGKKHIAKVKRYEIHQSLYGPTGLQVLYPPNPIAQSLYSSQVPQQTIPSQEGSYQAPVGAYIAPRDENPNPQLSDAPLQFNNQNAVNEVQQESTAAVPN